MENQNRHVERHVAYLSDYRAAAGASDLIDQMREAEGFATKQWAPCALRLFVDSVGSTRSGSFGPALLRLIDEVRAGTVTDVVIREYAVLASSRSAARRVVREFAIAGAQLHVLNKVDRRTAMTLSRESTR